MKRKMQIAVLLLGCIALIIFPKQVFATSTSEVNWKTWSGQNEPTQTDSQTTFQSSVEYQDSNNQVDKAASYISWQPGSADLRSGAYLQDTDGGNAWTKTEFTDYWTSTNNGMVTWNYRIHGSWLEKEWDYSELSFTHQTGGNFSFNFEVSSDGDQPQARAYFYYKGAFQEIPVTINTTNGVSSIDMTIDPWQYRADMMALPLSLTTYEKFIIAGDLTNLDNTGNNPVWIDFMNTFQVDYSLSSQGTIVSQNGRVLSAANPVPEPGTFTLFGLGLAGFISLLKLKDLQFRFPSPNI